jgi:LPXTG-site transpeptidase (sortase) family protein
VRRRPNPWTKSQRRRIAAALVLIGFAFLTPTLGDLLQPRSGDAQLDTRSQLERVLPVPDARSVGAKKPPRGRSANKRPLQRKWLQMPSPARLTIPAIGVSAPVISLGVNRDGTMETPDTVTDTGWFAPGPEPGEKGAAVITGHVDSYSGPGVFYHLRALRRGDRISVVLHDRRRVQFVVTGSKQISKDSFPTRLVFRRTQRPTLRLVTCGGLFDRSTGHYVDNYIVFARLPEYA